MLLTSRYVIPVSSVFDTYIEYGAVLVEGDRIVEVGPASDLMARHPGEEVRDFGMAAIMPGFVDCHSHLEFSLMRGILNDTPYASWKAFINEKMALLSIKDWFDSAYIGAYEALTAGITCVADVTFTGACLPAIDELGLRGIVYRSVGAPARKQVEEEMGRAVEQIGQWRGQVADTDRIQIGIAPENLFSCHPQILKEVADFANATGTPVAMHLAGSQEECDFIRYGSSVFSIANDSSDHQAFAPRQSVELLPAGCTPVQYALNWDILDVPQLLAVHCVKLEDHDIELLRDHGVSVAVTPRLRQAWPGSGTHPRDAPCGHRCGPGLRLAGGLRQHGPDCRDALRHARFARHARQGRLHRGPRHDPYGHARLCPCPGSRRPRGFARPGQEGRHHRHRPVRLASGPHALPHLRRCAYLQ